MQTVEPDVERQLDPAQHRGLDLVERDLEAGDGIEALLTIQAWLGHAQVATTHRYAAADVEMMRRGLVKARVSSDRSARFQPEDAVMRLLESI